jgi:acyl-CoA synthetase (AMP-forming)/AMP-acid ligase II
MIYIALNARHSATEHRDILNDAEADAIIFNADFYDTIDPIISSVESLRHLIVIGKAVPGTISYDKLVSAHRETEPRMEISDNDILRLQYTSGTTGVPKGAIYPFRMIYSWMENMLINLDKPISPKDANLNVGPITHATGNNLMLYFIKGARNVILERFDEDEVLWTIQNERITSMLVVPTMITRLLSHPNLHSYDLSSLKRIWYGTAPIPPEKLAEAVSAFGSIFRQNYGMTECPQPVTFLTPEEHVIEGKNEEVRRLASAGRPALGVELEIIDKHGNPVKPGEIGEIRIRSNKVAKGYWKKNDLTASCFKDGWFYAQDMATTDPEGYVYIVDRKNDMIISGGFNIYPSEVEKVLTDCEDVKEAAVIGIPDEIWGESVKAFVILENSARVSEKELIDYCRKNLSSYKKPKSIEFVQSLPQSSVGKLDRRALRESYWKDMDRRI